MLGTVVFFLFLGRAAAAAADCFPYGRPDAHLCTTHSTTYNDLHQQMWNAQHQEHFPDFIVNVTLGMHRYLYPCHSTVEAALRLFYDHIPIPDASSPWWGQMAAAMGIHETTLVGRRRRAPNQFNNENDLLRSVLDKIRTETTHGENCIQALINEFKAYAGSQFHTMYSGFVEPPQSVHTTHAPAATTTDPPTTHPPTTRPPTTATATTAPTTITQPPITTPTPVAARCTTCSGLNCLLSPTVGTCSTSLQEFCLTSVVDVQAGREITRRCATREECNSWMNSDECNDIEIRVLTTGDTCRYCCFGDNCNKPPQLLPLANTIYHRP